MGISEASNMEKWSQKFWMLTKKYLYKAMKKRNKLFILSMLLWGIEKHVPKANSHGMNMRELMQAWWISNLTQQMYVLHLHKR
jgi:hypothetical protein